MGEMIKEIKEGIFQEVMSKVYTQVKSINPSKLRKVTRETFEDSGVEENFEGKMDEAIEEIVQRVRRELKGVF